MYGMTSSRYNASFLFFNIFFLTYFFRKIVFFKSWKGIIVALLCVTGLIIFNTIKLNSSFRNNYIFDIKDDIRMLLSTDQSSKIYLDVKEFDRFYAPELSKKRQPQIDYSLPSNTFNKFYIHYCFWNSPVYFAYQFKETKTNTLSKLLKDNSQSGVSFQPVRRYYTNKNKNTSFLFLRSHVFIPPIPPEIQQRTQNGVLKTYNPDYDVYVFQIDDRLLWFVGKDITQKTEFLFFLFTNRPELLPPKRIVHGFDNKDFHVTEQKNTCEREKCGKYRVFEGTIPKEYPITSVEVGYAANGKHLWISYFDVN